MSTNEWRLNKQICPGIQCPALRDLDKWPRWLRTFCLFAGTRFYSLCFCFRLALFLESVYSTARSRLARREGLLPLVVDETLRYRGTQCPTAQGSSMKIDRLVQNTTKRNACLGRSPVRTTWMSRLVQHDRPTTQGESRAASSRRASFKTFSEPFRAFSLAETSSVVQATWLRGER